MNSISQLVESENHEEILNLEGDEFNKYKTIAAIHLGKFAEALKFVEKKSFEHAYIFYRLKKFKKALRILRNFDDKKSDILKSQCLYNLGYYADAYNLLSRHGSGDEYAVNLAAIESLDHLNNKYRFKASIFATKFRSSIGSFVSPIFTNNLCNLEYEYNCLFKLVDNEEAFLNALENLEKKYNIQNTCISQQIKNLNCESIINPTEKQKEVIRFNSGESTSIANPVHFQKNFVENTLTEYKLYLKSQNSSGTNAFGLNKHFCEILPAKYCNSEKLKIVHAFTCFKQNQGTEMVNHIRKFLDEMEDSDYKNFMMALVTRFTSSADKKQALQLLKIIKEK